MDSSDHRPSNADHARAVGFDARFQDVLITALAQMREASATDPRSVYNACAVAMQCVAPVDDFYVALIDEVNMVTTFPFLLHRGEVQPTSALPYGERGLTAWIIASRRSYTFDHDHGRLVNRGYTFGDDDYSADAIITPMLRGDRAIGLMAVLSNRPSVFGVVHVAAMEWLTRAATLVLTEPEPNRFTQLFDGHPELLAGGALEELNAPARDLQRIQSLAESAIATAASDPVATQALLREIIKLSQDAEARAMSRLVTTAADASHTSSPAWSALSRREREVAEALATDPDLSNAQLGTALGLAETTVKSHVAAILRKLELSSRREIHWVVRGAT